MPETTDTAATATNPLSDAVQSGPAGLNDLKNKVSDDLSAATDVVKADANTAMQKVQETVAEQTGFAARQVGGIATALQKVGAELEQSDQPQIGRYARQIGESVQAIAKNIEGRDLGEIAGMAEDFGRKQPLAFLSVAALAGLAASRFFTASAKRPETTKTQESSQVGSTQMSTSSSAVGGIVNG